MAREEACVTAAREAATAPETGVRVTASLQLVRRISTPSFLTKGAKLTSSDPTLRSTVSTLSMAIVSATVVP